MKLTSGILLMALGMSYYLNNKAPGNKSCCFTVLRSLEDTMEQVACSVTSKRLTCYSTVDPLSH
jgi:hypothetical protein